MKSIHIAALNVALASIVSSGLGMSSAHAEETKTPPVAKEPKKDAPATKDAPAKDGTAKADEPKVPEPDPFVQPENADAPMLVAFCKNLFGLQRNIKTREQYMDYQRKMGPALTKACEEILKLEKSETTENGRFARRNLLQLNAKVLMSGPAADAQAYMDSVLKFAEAQELDRADVGMLGQVVQGVEHTQGEKGVPFIQKVADLFKKSKDEKVAAYGKTFDGLVRRMSLVGKPMELKGTTVDGKPFELSSLKGKVVLVDFWATWCGPCRAELPNVKKNYEGYHGKGFEVVGISGDRDRKALDTFLEKDKLPWVTLHDNNGHNEAMDTYGINAFPTTLLVGKDGNVLALSARGPQLSKLLKEQLGEPEEPKPAPEKPADAPAKAPEKAPAAK